MKVSQLRDAMLEWAELLGEGEGPLEKQAITSLIEFLRGHEAKTAAALANKLKELSVPLQSDQGSDVVRVNTLVRQFKGLSRFCNHTKATAAAKDFDAIAVALLPNGAASVDELVAVAKTALAARSRSAPRARAAVDPPVIDSYVTRFQSTTDEAELDRVAEALKGDAAVSKDALSQIVNAISGHVGSFPNKKAAHEELRVALIEQARFRNKIQK